jgi:hypothetical protein
MTPKFSNSEIYSPSGTDPDIPILVAAKAGDAKLH